ncbi:MAG TPA: SIMPL domain-containing protein [Phycisphaerae bacterium]|nr:SIMPL domain-containing protein [Phycisphaerae bacterium]
MDYNIRFNFARTAAIVFAAAVVSVATSAVVASRAYVTRGEQAVRADQTIYVKGSTRKRIASNQAVWHIGVRGEHKELKEAYAILDVGIARIKKFLTDQGFKDAEISLEAINTTEFHARDAKGNETREITAYHLSRGFNVTSRDVQRIARAAGEVTQFIQEGVLVISCQPAYYYTGLPALKVDLMAEAAKDARDRADKIAGSAGCRVAEVRSAHMGVLQVTQPFSTDVSDEGTYDTETIEKDVQAVVTISFRIEPE